MNTARKLNVYPLNSTYQSDKIEKQQEKLEEFLTSYCDMFSGADFYYYAEVTGKDIKWIMSHAKYRSNDGILGDCLDNALIDMDLDLADLLV